MSHFYQQLEIGENAIIRYQAIKAKGLDPAKDEENLKKIANEIRKSVNDVEAAKNDAWKVAKEISQYTNKYGHLEGLKKMYKNAFREPTNAMS